jgi:hypothetical protein
VISATFDLFIFWPNFRLGAVHPYIVYLSAACPKGIYTAYYNSFVNVERSPLL